MSARLASCDYAGGGGDGGSGYSDDNSNGDGDRDRDGGDADADTDGDGNGVRLMARQQTVNLMRDSIGQTDSSRSRSQPLRVNRVNVVKPADPAYKHEVS